MGVACRGGMVRSNVIEVLTMVAVITLNIVLPYSPLLTFILGIIGVFITFRVVMRIVDYFPVV